VDRKSDEVYGPYPLSKSPPETSSSPSTAISEPVGVDGGRVEEPFSLLPLSELTGVDRRRCRCGFSSWVVSSDVWFDETSF
jgi:hypothetical protein